MPFVLVVIVVLTVVFVVCCTIIVIVVMTHTFGIFLKKGIHRIIVITCGKRRRTWRGMELGCPRARHRHDHVLQETVVPTLDRTRQDVSMDLLFVPSMCHVATAAATSTTETTGHGQEGLGHEQ